MTRADISGITNIIIPLGISPNALLGYGGESWVFALDERRVARVNRAGATPSQIAGRTEFLTELGRSAGKVPFAIPEVLDTISIAGYLVTIERRLPGRPLDQVLAELAGAARASLIRAYLAAAAQIGNLVVDRPWFGDLLQPAPMRTPHFRDYLAQRAALSLAAAGPGFEQVDPIQLAAALPEPETPALVHLDAFPGNMLADGEVVTAVIDFGTTALIGDRRLDPLAAAAYLAPEISPVATDRDRAVAQEWLAAAGLAGCYPAAQAWLAAYWAFAQDDVSLHAWCRALLMV